MTIETRPFMRLGIRAEPELERAVEQYVQRAGEQPDEGDGLTHWRCPDLCGTSCACTGPARRLKHAACSRPVHPTNWLGREEPRR